MDFKIGHSGCPALFGLTSTWFCDISSGKKSWPSWTRGRIGSWEFRFHSAPAVLPARDAVSYGGAEMPCELVRFEGIGWAGFRLSAFEFG